MIDTIRYLLDADGAVRGVQIADAIGKAPATINPLLQHLQRWNWASADSRPRGRRGKE